MRITTAVLATAGILLALTGCSSDTADPKACKAAMSKQADEAIAAGEAAEEGKRPQACVGVDAETLQRIAGELISEQTGKAAEDAVSTTPAPAGGITDECRAWIKDELLDATDTIDGTAGNSVCGDLTDAEMDQAIEDVTNDLSN
ncbi:hypothetical protein ACIG8S_23575 [[Kitasatospora] papulosa]|uniref:hypothetical protein n=1 Tax=Streptomyces TaxID=1883 RepID=UPI002E792710|nr:hypothetical protein [Streptomyces sp. JV181]MEE1779450.1 hypothetical protein [Streptomyces sp. JV181]